MTVSPVSVPPLRDTRGVSTAARILIGSSAAVGVAVSFPGPWLTLCARFVGPLSLAAAIVYLVWLVAVRKNAEALDPENVRRAPGWTVAEYFWPVLNLFAPAVTMIRVGRAGADRPVSRVLVIAWLVAWDARIVCTFASMGTIDHPTAVHFAFAWGTLVFNAIAAVLCVLMITAVERVQRTATVPEPAPEAAQALGTVS